MKAWLLFILGTLAYFFIRLMGRTDKDKSLDIVFWFKDNWIQMGGAVILDLIAMIIFTDPSINITGWLLTLSFIPQGLIGLTMLAIPAACGLGLGWGAYEFIKLFLKKKSDKSLSE
jgi:hypothetical protein